MTKFGLKYELCCACCFCIRFNGRIHVDVGWYKFMKPVNIRLYFGGEFVTRGRITTYERCNDTERWGLSLHPNVEEVCYFEFVDWIKKLGYAEVEGVCEIWYREHGCTLHNGRKEIKSDAEIADFLQSPENDGWYHLYLVDKRKGRFPPWVTFYNVGEGDAECRGSNMGCESSQSQEVVPLSQSNPSFICGGGGSSTQADISYQLSSSNLLRTNTQQTPCIQPNLLSTKIKTQKLPISSSKKPSETDTVVKKNKNCPFFQNNLLLGMLVRKKKVM